MVATTKQQQKERAHLIINAREAGETYRAIAARLGVSIERVRQIEHHWQVVQRHRVEYRSNGLAGLEELELSVRTYNTLRRAGFNSLDDCLIATTGQLRQIPNFGKGSLNELDTALHGIGLARLETADAVAMLTARASRAETSLRGCLRRVEHAEKQVALAAQELTKLRAMLAEYWNT